MKSIVCLLLAALCSTAFAEIDLDGPISVCGEADFLREGRLLVSSTNDDRLRDDLGLAVTRVSVYLGDYILAKEATQEDRDALFVSLVNGISIRRLIVWGFALDVAMLRAEFEMVSMSEAEEREHRRDHLNSAERRLADAMNHYQKRGEPGATDNPDSAQFQAEKSSSN